MFPDEIIGAININQILTNLGWTIGLVGEKINNIAFTITWSHLQLYIYNRPIERELDFPKIEFEPLTNLLFVLFLLVTLWEKFRFQAGSAELYRIFGG